MDDEYEHIYTVVGCDVPNHPRYEHAHYVYKDKQIQVSDDVQAKDNLGVWKRWFNGVKHFFTVKPLPPKR